jgi:DNA adenine methylase
MADVHGRNNGPHGGAFQRGQLARKGGFALDDVRARFADQIRPLCDDPLAGRVLVKWTGSKAKAAGPIVAQFPKVIDTYYEPFVGGGSVLYALLTSGITVGRIECSDICAPLIDLWNLVKHDPRRLLNAYETMWRSLQAEGKQYYYATRQTFNLTGDPCQFFFLIRTCRHGLIRFNRRGEFNVGFGRGMHKVEPEGIRPVLEDRHRLLKAQNVGFFIRDYSEIRSKADDLLYLDPPYRTELRFYHGKIDYQRFFEWLGRQGGAYILSLNGEGKGLREVRVPEGLYDECLPVGGDMDERVYVRRAAGSSSQLRR